MTADQEEANRTKDLLKASILMKATPYSAESSPATSVRGEMEMKEEEDEAGPQLERTPEVKIFIQRKNHLRFVYTHPKAESLSGGANFEKPERNGGGGDFDVIFQSKGIPS